MSTDTKSRIYAEAVRQFALMGYHGTSIRSISAALDIRVAGIYYYYPSKQEILLEIMGSFMDYLHSEVQEAVEGASSRGEESPRETHLSELRRVVATHIRCHSDRQAEAFIADTELRSLNAENRASIVEKRDRYEAVFLDILNAGHSAGVFRDADTSISAKAIITMCTGVAGWLNPNGRRSVDEVAEDFVGIALHGLVGAPRP